MKKRTKSVLVSSMTIDRGTQLRCEISEDTISEYAEAMRAGTAFPAVVLFQDGKKKILSSGFHRVAAAKRAGVKRLEAEIRQTYKGESGKRAAILFAAGENALHGLRRTNADKRRAVETILKDEKWGQRSATWVSDMAGVSLSFVQSVHGNLKGDHPHLSSAEVVGKDGVRQPRRRGRQKPARESTASFNRTNENIEWAAWSWNPVTGCEHGCKYCYARDIARRYYDHKFKPHLWEERLGAPKNMKFPKEGETNIGMRNVFTCSMADLFGEWVPDEWIEAVLSSIKKAPRWNFLFLTKNPRRYLDFTFPRNAWLGTTVDVQKRVRQAVGVFSKINPRVSFLSCEPLFENLTFPSLTMFDWVIIGGASASSKTPPYTPKAQHVESLVSQAREAKCKVYFKPNLGYRPTEYPTR